MADNGSNIPKWVWVITPTLAVAFLGFILYLSTVPAGNELDAVKGDARKALQQGAEAIKNTAKDAPKPDYDFYRLLENQTVEVPKVEAYKSTPKDDIRYEYRWRRDRVSSVPTCSSRPTRIRSNWRGCTRRISKPFAASLRAGFPW